MIKVMEHRNFHSTVADKIKLYLRNKSKILYGTRKYYYWLIYKKNSLMTYEILKRLRKFKLLNLNFFHIVKFTKSVPDFSQIYVFFPVHSPFSDWLWTNMEIRLVPNQSEKGEKNSFSVYSKRIRSLLTRLLTSLRV